MSTLLDKLVMYALINKKCQFTMLMDNDGADFPNAEFLNLTKFDGAFC